MLSTDVFGCPHFLCSFLDNIHRIMEKDYEPSDDDVSRVRSRIAPGVQEYHYLLDTGACYFLVERVRLHIVADPL
jgi:hypothetical protein